ncbi:MAG TPA: tetratricopeptide repeat protein [Polyangiaceae bacterium]|nr:tetratricopeptide repeat protein [Polyangiaceae bacterium]
MAVDREKILQAAQKHVDKKKFDKAIQEYQKIIQQDPNDARTLLKIGDLQARMEAYAEAIATYDRVGQFYSAQGFALKAIAVYKQIRELIKKHVPQLEDRYGHIVPKLATIYTELGLTSDALAAYDEVATRLQRAGRDRDAIDVFRKMVALDATNPLPHLRLAEACCRVQSVDEAIDSFWTAAELLIRLQRRDDALKVVERILHFRAEARYARVAAELYLERGGGHQDGLQALAKLQLCFQADPKNLEVLDLLSRAFVAIGQAPKALEVKKEMARLAREQGRDDILADVLGYLERAAPEDEQVKALLRGDSTSMMPDSTSYVDADVEAVDPSVHPQRGASRRPSAPTRPDVEDDFDFDEAPMSRRSLSVQPDADVEIFDDEPGRPFMRSSPDVIVEDEELEGVEEISDADIRAHARKAISDAESFRGLRLYSKAIETLRIALEIDPQSIEVRQKLRDILFDAGDRDGAIGEMISLAAIHMDQGENELAENELYRVLDSEPGHATAFEMLEQIAAQTAANDEPEAAYSQYTEEHYDSTTTEVAEPELIRDHNPDAPLPSYDLEEISATAAIADGMGDGVRGPTEDSFSARDSQFDLRGVEDLDDYLEDVPQTADAGRALEAPRLPDPTGMNARPLSAAPVELIEEALEEAEFFTSRGLVEDARTILVDALGRAPNHPLIMERLRELDGAIGAQSGTHERTDPGELLTAEDRAFDLAASLDALDVLEQATRSSRPPTSLRNIDDIDVDQVFAKFKEGVRAQISDSDSSTHYDLGVAYKEMGLLPDAISEFKLATRDTRYECTSNAMVGMIQLELGQLDEAAESYIAALGAPQKTIDQEMSLYYDLGTVYEMKRSTPEALYYFQKIARRDPGYRDVRDRIDALEPRRAQPQQGVAGMRQIQSDDELEAAFDDLFESK